DAMTIVLDQQSAFRVWDVATETPRCEFGRQGAGATAAFAPDDRRIVTVSPFDGVAVWDARTCSLIVGRTTPIVGSRFRLDATGSRMVAWGTTPVAYVVDVGTVTTLHA